MTAMPYEPAPAVPAIGEQSTALLGRILDTFHDAVLVTEPQPLDEPGPRIVYANGAFSVMTGYSPAEVLGRSCRFLQGPDTDSAARRTMRQGLEAAERVQVEVVNYKKDGSPFWVELLISALRSDDGDVTHFVSVQRDTTSRKLAELRLERRLLRSELTGLPNRAGFERAIEEALASTGGSLAVLLIDVAGLRHVNFRFGREGGDALVLEIAARLRRLADQHVVVAHLDGGEFGLLTQPGTVPSVVRLCERLRRAMLTPFTVVGTELRAVVSGGVAVRDESSTTATLLREADVARRVASSAESGRYELYEPEMGLAVERRLDIDQGVRSAVSNGELVLHHQPIVALSDGTTDHVEALVRWNRPGHGFVSPASFIPVAESSGAIVPVGTWVLTEACRQAAGWQAELPGVGVAVNLSPRQFAVADLSHDVALALDGLPAELLTLEITEGALVTDPEAAAVKLQGLAELGVRIALDDFGTGYSSLAYLKRLPVHSVKIDKVFVDGIEHDTGDRAIVRAVLALAGDLGLEVVAEGIETQAQREALLTLGCSRGQGYLFARPVHVGALADACGSARRVARRPG